MSLSLLARQLSESATLKLNATAAQLRGEGAPVIHLGGGEPESKVPPGAIKAATELVQSGEVRYTPASGTREIKDAIVHYTGRYYDYEVGRENVMAAAGAKQALMNCLLAILDPGDEVIVPRPYWVSYPDMVALARGVTRFVLPDPRTLEPRIGDIEALVTDRTKAIIFNSPNNPSGGVYSAELVRAVVELCEERGIYLLLDDIYHRLLFDGRLPVSCYRYARKHGDESRIVVINGVSKSYAMTGFRLGWAVAAKHLTKIMSNVQGHMTSGPSTVSQAAAAAAIRGDQGSVDELARGLEGRRDRLLHELGSLPGLEVNKPGGAFYCFADLRAFDSDSRRLAAFLLDKALVVTVPGFEFGMEGHLRLSFCGKLEDIVEGAQRIRRALTP